MAIEPAALHLRFRDDASTATPEEPDVGAFLRSRASTSRGRGGSALPEELGVIPGARALEPEAPLVIFLQRPEFGIPAPGFDHALPDLASWSVRPTTFGWLASVPRATRSQPRRAAQLLAGCLALALPTHAEAFALAPPPVQTAGSASSPTRSASEAPTEPAEATPTSDTTTATTTPAPIPEPTPIVRPPPPSLYGNAVTDAAWEGVDGFEVALELKGGKVLRGTVGAVQADTFTLIESESGQVLVIPKSGVSSLRAYVPPPVPTKTGTGLIVGGSVLTALGVPIFITGVAFVAICPSCVYLHLPMLVLGGGAIGGGIPMIAKGSQRRTAFQKAVEERRIRPVAARTPYGGWTGGLQLRF